MDIRNRVKELRFVRAGDLRPHPLNWRTHPDNQRAALSGILQEIGYADALIARVDGDGELELIDGHLRQDLTPDMEVPVLVTDLSESEGKLLLATLDPLAALAEADAKQLDALLHDVQVASQDIADVLTRMASDAGILPLCDDIVSPEIDIVRQFAVLVECDDETNQRQVFEMIREKGYKCKLLTL